MDHFFFIIPYRNRPNCLEIFKKEFPAFLRTQDYIDSFKILIVEQEEGKPFNLAKIINTGFAIAVEQLGLTLDDTFIFHPVDCIPVEGTFMVPEQGAVVFCDGDPERRERDKGFSGKAHGFRAKTFMDINGYSNEYWGWGCEDNDLFIRLDVHGFPIIAQFLTYKVLMGHSDDRTPDIDISDVATAYYLKNKVVLDQMIIERDPMKSGLTTLSYMVVQDLERISNDDPLFHVKVAI